MQKKQKYLFFLFCLIIAIFSLAPYLTGGVNLEHDTCFHLSRIEGLAQSFKDGIYMPRIYPYKNNNFGYASPLFYSDFFLVIPALLYNAGVSLARSYQLLLLGCSFFSAWFMGKLTMRLNQKPQAAYLASFLYVFSLYRLTDVYVRGALGEVLAFVFMPVALIGIYEVLWDNENQWPWLMAGYAGLVLSHNITFYLMVIILIAFLVLRFKKWSVEKTQFYVIIKAALWAAGLCFFYLGPMLEQLLSQEFYLHYYAASSDLASTALNAWQYTEMSMNFAISNIAYGPGQAMTTNLGFLIPVLPLLGIFLFHNNKTSQSDFLFWLSLLGFSAYFLCSRLFPWEYLAWMRIIQFPWRLMSIASLFLCPVAAITTVQFFDKYSTRAVFVLVIGGLIVGVIRIMPVQDRPILLDVDMSYESLIDGTLLDPYYGNSFYVRPEVAGADYLPVSQTDYRTVSQCVVNENNQNISCDIEKKGYKTSFKVENAKSNTWLQIPITYYKGYTAFALDTNNNKIALNLRKNKESGLIEINNKDVTSGLFVINYSGTGIQTGSTIVSLITICLWLIRRRIDLSQKG